MQEELRSLLNVIVILLGCSVQSLMVVMIKAELQNRNLCRLSTFNIRLCYFEGGNGSCKQEISILQERRSQIYVGCWEQCLCASISCRQCDVEAVLVQPHSLFLESQFAVWYGLVNIVVCTALSSEWMTHSQLCQST